MGDGTALYQSFLSATQEPVRLDLAVRCYFGGEVSTEASRELEAYLKRRVRPLMELLMRQDALPKLEQLSSAGWLSPQLVEDGLDMAIRLKKTEAFVWLLRWKAEHSGFPDRDFSL